jgi:hypothetical protein
MGPSLCQQRLLLAFRALCMAMLQQLLCKGVMQLRLQGVI